MFLIFIAIYILHVENYLYSSKIAMATVLWNSHVSLPTGSIKEGGRRNPCLNKQKNFTIKYYYSYFEFVITKKCIHFPQQ